VLPGLVRFGSANLPSLTGEERAEQERLRAEQAETLLEQERLRAERLAERLRTLVLTQMDCLAD